MSDFKKLIDGLPIVFRGKSEDYADEGEIPIIVFRESDYLALMDEAEQKPAVETSKNPFQGPQWDLSEHRIYGIGPAGRNIDDIRRRVNDLVREFLRMRGGE